MATRRSSSSSSSSPTVEKYSSSHLVPVPDPTVLTTQQLQREILTTREVLESYIDGLKDTLETRLNGMDKASELLYANTTKTLEHSIDSIDQLHKLHEEKFRSIDIQFSEREKRFDVANKDTKEAVAIATVAHEKTIDFIKSSIVANTAQMALSLDNLKTVNDEKFHSITLQFIERDVRTEQSSKDSKVAVDAALQAAKEAVDQQNKSNALAIAKSETTFTKQIDQIGALIATLQKGLDDKIDDLKTRVQAVESTKKGGNEMMGFVIGALGITVAVIAGIVNLIPRALH